MKIDLASQAKAAGTKRKRIELREIKTTKAQENDLARLYMAVVRVWAEGASDVILPAYRLSASQRIDDSLTTDSARDVQIAIDSVNESAARSTITFRGRITDWINRLQAWHLDRIIRQLLYTANVDLRTQMHAADVAETLDDVLARNVALVRDISDQARGRISEAAFRGLQARTPARDVAKEIAKATSMARDRALRVAMDQTQKLASSLDRERQLQLGMTSFEWVHSRKKHPRQEHVERDGKTFEWSSEVGRKDPPGYLPFCGCKAKGILNLGDD